jgi:hypothetical protein
MQKFPASILTFGENEATGVHGRKFYERQLQNSNQSHLLSN